MINLNGSKGLGDALYVRAVARHLLWKENKEVTVFTRWPEVFRDLPLKVKALGDLTGQEDIHPVVYCSHCRVQQPASLDFFTLACRQAGIVDEVDLFIDWKVKNKRLVESIRLAARGRRIFVYQSPKKANGPEQEVLRPRREAFNRYIENHKDCYRVRLGHPSAVEDDKDAPLDMDLFGKISVSDALDVGASADLLFSDPSFITVMAESMGKRFTAMLSRRVEAFPNIRARAMTADRLFHNKNLLTVVYDE